MQSKEYEPLVADGDRSIRILALRILAVSPNHVWHRDDVSVNVIDK
jgi:hypothetical protein